MLTKSNTPRLFTLTHKQKREPNGNVASLGGAVRNESEAILEMKSSSNSLPYTIDSEDHRVTCRRLTQSPRNGGDQPSSQGHGIQSGPIHRKQKL